MVRVATTTHYYTRVVADGKMMPVFTKIALFSIQTDGLINKQTDEWRAQTIVLKGAAQPALQHRADEAGFGVGTDLLRSQVSRMSVNRASLADDPVFVKNSLQAGSLV